MKRRTVLIALALLVVSLFILFQSQGRGGGGRGGGGVGQRGASRGPGEAARVNKNMNRTPSMSPPRQMPQRPTPLPARQNLPPAQRPTHGGRALNPPSQASSIKARNDTKQFTQRLRHVDGNRPTKMQAPHNFNLQQQVQLNRQAASSVGARVNLRYPNSRQWFNQSFFDTHRTYPFFRQAGANWWWGPSWAYAASWGGYGWEYPYYYYYPGYIDTGYPPASDLYLQLQGEALSTPSTTQQVVTDSGTWLPLGVFALGASVQDASFSNFFFQLAVDKDGDIAGTFYNAATDETHPVDGYLDKQTQQAIWKMSDTPDSPTMMTGVYNLTQDATPVQIYFLNEVQEWALVRLQENA